MLLDALFQQHKPLKYTENEQTEVSSARTAYRSVFPTDPEGLTFWPWACFALLRNTQNLQKYIPMAFGFIKLIEGGDCILFS